MPTSFTTNLRLSNPGLGDTGWGSTVSNGMIDLVDPAISGTTSVSVTAGNVTLTSLNGVADQARQMFLVATGTPGVPRDVIVPSTSKLYFVKNDANDTVTFKVLGQPGVAVPAGSAMALRVNGTDVVVAQDQFVTLKATGNVTFDGGAFVFNESGADKDARFEGDTDANLLFLDASTDRVGIGTATPTEKLSISQGNVYVVRTGGAKLRLADQNNEVSVESLPVGLSSEMVFKTNTVERMRLDSSGNLGIGTSSPGAKLQLNGGASPVRGIAAILSASVTGAQLQFTQGGVDDWAIGQPAGTSAFAFWAGRATGSDGAERMRLDSSGRLLVGTSSANISSARYSCFNAPSGANVACSFKNDGGAAAQVVEAWNSATTGNNNFVTFYTETSATARGEISYNRSSGLVAYGTTSDYRAKEIIGPVQNPGATIDALRVYEGVMKGATQSRPMLVAHEAQEHVPYAVSGQKDEVNQNGTPKFQQIDVSSLVPLLLAELQSLRARVATLEAA